LGLADEVGDFSEGKQFDAVWLRPAAGTPLDVGIRHADASAEALAKAFAMGTTADVARVYIGGQPIESAARLPAYGSAFSIQSTMSTR